MWRTRASSTPRRRAKSDLVVWLCFSGPVDVIAFLDVLNVYGAATSDEQEFDTATGQLVVEGEGEIFPLIGSRKAGSSTSVHGSGVRQLE